MATNRPRAVLALLCVAALCYGSVLVQPGLNADLGGSGEGPGVEIAPPTPEPSTSTPTETDRSTATTSTPTPNATATPTPTRTETLASDGDDGGNGGGGIWGTLIGVAGAGVVLLGGVLFALRGIQTTESRGDRGSPSIPALAGSMEIPALPRISQVTAAVLLTSAKGIARVFDDLGTVVGGVLRVLGNGAGPALGMFARGLASIPVAIVSGIAAPLAALGSVGSGASSFVSDGLSKASSIRSDTPETDARTTAAPEIEANEGPDPAESVAEAWHRMVERVSVRNPAARTPVEYADAAIERGLPSGPVRRLTDLYRRIRYGPDTESDRHLEQARDALDAIRGGED